MGLIKRLKRITSSRIEAFLQSVENPESIFQQLVQEMKNQVKVAINAETKSLASVRAAQRKLDESEGTIRRFAKGAELALEHGEEPIAREALAAQMKTEQYAEQNQESLDRAESALNQARSTREQMESQLADLLNRKEEIITRARSVKTQKQIVNVEKGGNSILEQVSRIENKLEEEEATAEINREMSGKSTLSLDERLRSLERESEIKKRLDKLRKRR